MQTTELNALAKKYDAYVPSDGSRFRRVARSMQSVWRSNRGYPAGHHKGILLGSRLPEDYAKETLANYLTPTIRNVVRTELEAAVDDRLFATPRIYNDLLSSQPLCFNLFGELQADLEMASRLFRSLSPDSVSQVTDIRFEYSPGRGDPRFSGDRSAFDVFVEYIHKDGGRGFFGIEVKYHENLVDKPAKHRARYDEIAAAMACFRSDAVERLRSAPLQQIWRDHLLTGITKKELDYREGMFVFLYPSGNTHCASAISAYRDTLTNMDTFAAWTLEMLTTELKNNVGGQWIDDFYERYLDFSIVRRLLKEKDV